MANRINIQVGYTVDKTGLQQLQTSLNDIIVKAKLPGSGLNEGLQKAASTAKTLEGILNKAFNANLGTLNVSKFNQELLKTNINLREVKSSLSGAGVAGATAFNALSSSILNTNVAIKQSSKFLDDMATTMSNTIKWGVTSGIFNNITGSISKAVTYAEQLDHSLNDIRIVTDKSAESMSKFAEEANTAAKNLGASTLDYTKASLIYYQQGLSDEEVKARTETTLKAANVTGQTGEAVSEQLTAVWNGYKVTAEETELYVDKLAAVAATTASNLEELSTGMSKVASAASAMGVNVDQLNGMLSTIISVTRQAPESAGTALKTIFARIEDLELNGEDEFGISLGEVSSSLESMGVHILDAQGSMRELGEVIEEVGNKWNSGAWSEAKKQALAIDLAGKRQYNNLLALFENWEQYTKAVETSTNAVGTLQHQQDIHMESTNAKLKILKATWQDLYGSLINKDELDAGIEGLTNLVQVFDNFIDSFGGGIKAIGAFGAIVANIFNKQIAASITNAVLNQEKYAQNVDLLKMKMESIGADSISAMGGTATDVAIQQQLETELKYAQQIQQVRASINSKQYNELTTLQQKIGQLEYEATLTEQTALAEAKKVQGISETELAESSYLETLSLEVENRKAALDLTANYTNEIQKQVNGTKIAVGETEKLGEILGSLYDLEESLVKTDEERLNIQSQISAATKQNLENLLKEIGNDTTICDTEESIRNIKAKILKLVQDINREEQQGVTSAQKRANVTEAYQQALEQAANVRRQEGQVEQEFNKTLDYAQRAVSIGVTVTTVTSSLSSMAMAWSTVNSMFQIWNDESATLGDKIVQTLMSVGIAIPMVVSSFSKLNAALGITASLHDVMVAKESFYNVVQDKTIAKQLIKNGLLKQQNVEKNKEILTQSIVNRLEEKYAAMKGIEVGAISASMKARIAETAAKKANNIITEEAIALQNTLNASILANPYLLIAVAAVAAIAGVTSAIISHNKKIAESELDKAEAALKAAKEEQDAAEEHKKAIEDLQNAYKNIADTYEKNEITLEELRNETYALCKQYGLQDEAIKTLSASYKELNELINSSAIAANNANIQSAQQTQEAAKNALVKAMGTQNVGRSFSDWIWSPAGSSKGIEYNTGYWTSEDEAAFFNELMGAIGSSLTISPGGGAGGVGVVNFEGWEEEIARNWDKIQSVLANYTQLSDNNIYKKFNSYFSDIEEYVLQYRDALDLEKNANLDNIGLEEYFNGNIKSYQDYLDTLGRMTEKAKAYFDDDEDAAWQWAESYLNKFAEIKSLTFQKDWGDSIADLIADKIFDTIPESEYAQPNTEGMITGGIQQLPDLDKYITAGDVHQETKETVQKALEELRQDELGEEAFQILLTLGVDKARSLEEFYAYIELAKKEAEVQDIELKLDVASSTINSLLTGNELTEEQLESLKELEKEFPKLASIMDKTSADYVASLLEVQQALENQRIEIRKQEEEILKEHAISIDVNADTEEFMQAMKELAEKDYEVLVAVKTDIQSDFNNVVTEMERIETMASKIGEDFIVAAKDIEELNDVFPGILANMELVGDGTVKLNSEIVQSAMEAARAEVALDTDKTIEKLKNQADELQAKRDAARNIAEIAENLVGVEKLSDEQIGQLDEALNQLKSDNSEEVADQVQNDDVNMADTAAENATSMAQSFGGAYEQMAQDSVTWAEIAHQALLAATDVNQAVPSVGSFGGASFSTTSNITAKQSEKADLSTYADYADVEDWQQIADYYNSLADSYDEAYSNTLGKIAELLARGDGSKDLFNRIGSGEGPNKKTDSEKQKDPKVLEYLEDEADRYHDINLEIEEINTNLSRLNKQQKKLFGKDLLKNLNDQLAVLEKQKDAYQRKIELAKQEAAELRASLTAQGVSFSSDGYIFNYAAALQAKLDYVNSLIAQYNAMSAEEQEAFQKTVDQAKKDYENFKKQIENYDKLISDTIPDLEDQIQDAVDKEIEINIQKFTMEVELRLDMAEAERDFNEFKRKIIDEIKDDDILDITKSKLKDYTSYFNTEETGIGPVQKLTSQINNTIDQIKQIDNNGWADAYGNNKTQAIKDLQEYYKNLMKQLEDVVDLVDEIKESYLDMIDEAVEAFDKQVDQYEYIKDLLNHDMNIVGLIYGDKAYAQMTQYYEKIEQNNSQELDFLKKRVAYTEEMMQKETDPEAKKKWEEEWMDALEKLNEKVEDSIQNLIDKYQNAINKVFDELNKKITNGKGLDYVNDEWDLINKNADQYLDTINSMYAIQDLENKYLEALDQTDSLSAQQKLNDMMNEQLGMLKDKDKLTQYDIDRANTMYELTLKQIALEEAQQNKSKMRLRRDSQGNYSYQFVSDEDSIAQTQQDLLAAQNDLYNFDKEKYEENLNEIYEYYVEFQEKYTKIMSDMSLTDEERQERVKLLQEEYGELINGLIEQNETIKQNLYESTFMTLEGLYAADADSFREMTGKDIEAFRDLTNIEKDLVINDLIPQWDSGIQHMADIFAGEGGFIPICKDAFKELEQVTNDYQDSLDELESTAGVDFDAISEGYDENVEKAQDLLYTNNDLINKYMEEIDAILDVIAQLEDLIAKYKEAQTTAVAATKAAYAFVQAQKEVSAAAAGDSDNNSDGGSSNSSSSGGGSGSDNNSGKGSSNSSSSGSGGDGVPKVGDVVTYTGGLYYYDSYGTKPTGSRGPGKKVTITHLNPSAPYPIHVQSSDSAYGWLKQSQISGYDTGGYTGDWGDSSGKLAFLHKKELVLNNDDTANFLTAIGIVRDMAGMLNNLNANVMDRLLSLSTGFGIPMSGVSAASDTIEQNVHIEASFPNVQNSQEIENAFNNLVNIASQRAFKTKK